MRKHGTAIDPLEMTLDEADQQGYQPEKPISTALASIRIKEDGKLTIGGFTMTRVGLQVQAGVKQSDWQKIGAVIGDLGKSIQWLIGDYIAFGIEREYGETYEWMSELTGYEVQTLRNMVYTCLGVDLSLRSDKLNFGHHVLVAALRLEDGSPDISKQHYWLKKAEVGELSISQLRDAIKGNPPTPPSDVVVNKKFHQGYHKIFLAYNQATHDERRQMVAALRQLLDDMESKLK